MPPLFGRTIVTLAVLPIIKELSLSLWAYAALSVNHLLSARKRACSPLIFSFRLIVTHNGHDGLLTKIRFAHKKAKNMRPSAINKDKIILSSSEYRVQSIIFLVALARLAVLDKLEELVQLGDAPNP